MFQFRRFPTYAYLIQRRLTEYCSAGFPHSEISGSTVICTSPKLIAACHVLHRLLMPRHSPCALLRLTLLSCEQESKQKLSWTTTLRRVSCFLCCPTLRSTKKGLALVLKRLNYAGSEFFEIVLCYPFEKFHKSFLFPSVACSSYLVTLFSFQGAFPASFETRSKHLNFKCLYPTSKFSTMKFLWPTFFFQKKVGGLSGLEPPTSRLSVVRSSQLSYGSASWTRAACLPL